MKKITFPATSSMNRARAWGYFEDADTRQSANIGLQNHYYAR